MPSSKRYVTLEQAARIFAAASPAKTVLVTMDMPVNELQNAIENLRPYSVQLHGNESPEYASCILRSKVWKAFNLGKKIDFDYSVEFPAEFIVADSGGGAGIPCDWRLAARLAQRRRILLAGGIDACNVLDAAAAVQPFGIDVSSGVESSPGIKDAALISRLATLVSRL